MRSIALLLAVAVVVMVSVSILQYQQLLAMRTMNEAVRIAWNLPRLHDMTTSWISGGTTHSVTTNHQDNWTLAQWQDRHFNAVRLEQANFPPDN